MGFLFCYFVQDGLFLRSACLINYRRVWLIKRERLSRRTDSHYYFFLLSFYLSFCWQLFFFGKILYFKCRESKEKRCCSQFPLLVIFKSLLRSAWDVSASSVHWFYYLLQSSIECANSASEMESERFGERTRSVFALSHNGERRSFSLAARFAGRRKRKKKEKEETPGNVCVMQQTRSLYRGTSLQNRTYANAAWVSRVSF